MKVSVVYCLPDNQEIIKLEVDDSCSVGQAIEQSGLLGLLEDQPLETINIGVFGKKCSIESQLHADDRVEIYRDLLLSPAQARKLRAKIQAAKG
jgi:putative ubiquitin-RnfH superfamily antitoxin RatB of RatAB toxin-antitoxin module